VLPPLPGILPLELEACNGAHVGARRIRKPLRGRGTMGGRKYGARPYVPLVAFLHPADKETYKLST
jgi:hypothetical protein